MYDDYDGYSAPRAYGMGYNAFIEGVDYFENPFSFDDDLIDFLDWQQGYIDARVQELTGGV